MDDLHDFYLGCSPASKKDTSRADHKSELLRIITDSNTISDYSDLTIFCRDKTYKVHRLLVCPQSGFLSAACKGGFKEAYTSVIQFDDEDPQMIANMITFFYSGNYPKANCDQLVSRQMPAARAPPNLVNRAPIHAKMYSLADRLMANGLMEFSKAKFRKSITYPYRHGSFPDVVKIVYQSTPETNRDLRDMVVAATMASLIRGTRNSASSLFGTFENEVLLEVPQFCYDLCVALVGQKPIVRSRILDNGLIRATGIVRGSDAWSNVPTDLTGNGR